MNILFLIALHLYFPYELLNNNIDYLNQLNLRSYEYIKVIMTINTFDNTDNLNINTENISRAPLIFQGISDDKILITYQYKVFPVHES